jgi:hypothetical protein
MSQVTHEPAAGVPRADRPDPAPALDAAPAQAPAPEYTYLAYPQRAHPQLAYAGGMALAPADPASRLALRLFGRAPSWVAPLSIAVCFSGGVAYTLIDHPTDAGAFSSPTCLVKLSTGFDCPGCGGTRAFWYLLHGNLPAAARSHLLAVFAFPFLIYMYIAWAGNLVFKKKLPMLRIAPKTISIFIAVWAVFTVLRNIPIAPFTWFFV